jgi:predicted enzyme related to lactoylglutathione lyase
VGCRVRNLKATDVRTFVPAKDFAVSKAFYTALGWKLTEITEKLALIELAERRLYLQDYYVKEWAENFVIFIAVEDAQAWHDHISAALEERSYLDARVLPPKEEDWGALTTHAIDPSGVLIHFTQWIRC